MLETSIFSFPHNVFRQKSSVESHSFCRLQTFSIWFVCLAFYAVSTVFQLFNSDSSQIHVSWTIFNQYLTSLLSWHWRACRRAIPIILGAKGFSVWTRLKFYRLGKSNANFDQFQICRLRMFEIWQGLKFSVWGIFKSGFYIIVPLLQKQVVIDSSHNSTSLVDISAGTDSTSSRKYRVKRRSNRDRTKRKKKCKKQVSFIVYDTR